jgi:hypothetical protein
MRIATHSWLTIAGCCWLAGAAAQEAEPDPAPDLDFLEYLGAWAEEDDEWLAIEEWSKDDPDDDSADEAEREDENDAGE